MKQDLNEKLWRESKPAKEYPKDWLVIPTLEVIEIIDEESETK